MHEITARKCMIAWAYVLNGVTLHRALSVREPIRSAYISRYYLFIHYMIYTRVKSFTIVKNRKCGAI